MSHIATHIHAHRAAEEHRNIYVHIFLANALALLSDTLNNVEPLAVVVRSLCCCGDASKSNSPLPSATIKERARRSRTHHDMDVLLAQKETLKIMLVMVNFKAFKDHSESRRHSSLRRNHHQIQLAQVLPSWKDHEGTANHVIDILPIFNSHSRSCGHKQL